MKIGEIEKGIPNRAPRNKDPRKHKHFDLIKDLERGDSRLVIIEDGENVAEIAQRVRSYLYNVSVMRSVIPGRFSVKVMSDKSFRVWRVS